MKLFRTLCMDEPGEIERSVFDSTTKQVNWKPPKIPNPNYIPPASKSKDNVTLSFSEYNDMLTKIYYLEHKNEWLNNVNKHLGEEIELLQKQLLNRKLRKVRFICKLKRKCVQ